jgi:ferritin-like metal-binding protein YciE
MKIDSLLKLWVHELKDLYSAEKQLVKALPKMIEAASNPELKAALGEHLEETKGHVARLESIFKKDGSAPGGHHCKGMEGLLMEGDDLIKDATDPEVRDAGIISSCQRVEHYEIAGYGTAAAFCRAAREGRGGGPAAADPRRRRRRGHQAVPAGPHPDQPRGAGFRPRLTPAPQLQPRYREPPKRKGFLCQVVPAST